MKQKVTKLKGEMNNLKLTVEGINAFNNGLNKQKNKNQQGKRRCDLYYKPIRQETIEHSTPKQQKTHYSEIHMELTTGQTIYRP